MNTKVARARVDTANDTSNDDPKTLTVIQAQPQPFTSVLVGYILSYLDPVGDLLSTAVLVCRHWRMVVMRSPYLWNLHWSGSISQLACIEEHVPVWLPKFRFLELTKWRSYSEHTHAHRLFPKCMRLQFLSLYDPPDVNCLRLDMPCLHTICVTDCTWVDAKLLLHQHPTLTSVTLQHSILRGFNDVNSVRVSPLLVDLSICDTMVHTIVPPPMHGIRLDFNDAHRLVTLHIRNHHHQHADTDRTAPLHLDRFKTPDMYKRLQRLKLDGEVYIDGERQYLDIDKSRKPRLFENLMAHVFGFLDPLTDVLLIALRVCQEWKAIIKTTAMHDIRMTATSVQMIQVHRFYWNWLRHVTTLRVTRTHQPHEEERYDQVIALCSRLVALHISFQRPDHEVYFKGWPRSDALQTLTIENGYSIHLGRLLPTYPTLTNITLVNCCFVDKKKHHIIVLPAPLRQLSLKNTIFPHGSIGLTLDFRRASRLTSLCLENPIRDMASNRTPLKVIELSNSTVPDLQRLRLVDDIHWPHAMAHVQQFSKLQLMDLSIHLV